MEKILERLGVTTKIADEATLKDTIARFKERKMSLPTFAELANPALISDDIKARLANVDPDAPDPLNLYRVHWYNAPDRKGFVEVPVHLVLTKEITGIDAPARLVITLGYAAEGDSLRPKQRKALDTLVSIKD